MCGRNGAVVRQEYPCINYRHIPPHTPEHHRFRPKRRGLTLMPGACQKVEDAVRVRWAQKKDELVDSCCVAKAMEELCVTRLIHTNSLGHDQNLIAHTSNNHHCSNDMVRVRVYVCVCPLRADNKCRAHTHVETQQTVHTHQ